MSKRFQRIAVLKGGFSPERDVSLVSGAAAADALRSAGYEAIEIDVDRDIAQKLTEIAPDAVFNALHGQWGEDGCVQGLLELMAIPYTHSGVLASALAMDKQRAKAVFDRAGIPSPEGVLVTCAEAAKGSVMATPFVMKPNAQGSSVGVCIVRDGDNRNFDEFFANDWSDDDEVLVERYIPGRELTVTVMGDRALCVTEITTELDFYDYEAKYATGGSKHILPADLPEEIEARCMEMALSAHQALGCRGLSRADFRYDEKASDETLFCLEVNTQPGLTPTSLSPEQAAHLGIDFPALCAWMIEDASCRR